MCFGGGSKEPKVVQQKNPTFTTVATETPDVTQRVMEQGGNPKQVFGSTLGSYSNTPNVAQKSGS